MCLNLLSKYCHLSIVKIVILYHFTVDGRWGDWQGWSTCSTTCDDGTATRHRECNNPAPAHGGLNCAGTTFDHKTCNLAQCPGTLGLMYDCVRVLFIYDLNVYAAANKLSMNEYINQSYPFKIIYSYNPCNLQFSAW